MSVPSSVLDAGSAGVLHRTLVLLPSYTLVVFFSMYALQMLPFSGFLLDPCMHARPIHVYSNLNVCHDVSSIVCMLFCCAAVCPVLDAMLSGVQHPAMFKSSSMLASCS